MDVSEMLSRELCEPQLHARRKEAVIKELAHILKRHPGFSNVKEDVIRRGLQEREELGSTGFGGGLAIPHCRLKGLDRFILALCVSRRGVHFDAMDNRKVHLLCVMVGPDDKPREHVRILAEISTALKSEAARKEMIKAPTQMALYESFLRHVLRTSGVQNHRKRKLLMLVLQNEDFLVDVMELFVDMGIRGASVMESRAMGKVLTTVPLFASFINFLGSGEEYERTVFAVVPDDQIPRLITAIEDITGDMDRHTGAMVIVLDIAMMKGTLQSI